MPVKVVNKQGTGHQKSTEYTIKGAVPNSETTLTINRPQTHMPLVALIEAEAEFKSRYFANVVGGTFSDSITVDWNDFTSAITQNIQDSDLGRLAVNFIHRYDPVNVQWFLCAEVVLLAGTPSVLSNELYNVYNVESSGDRYDLNNGSITPSTLDSSNSFDPLYFANIVDENGVATDYNKHINSIIFPWESEILKMSDDNNLDTQGLQLKIVSCSMNFMNYPDESLVQWPHGIALYQVNGDAEYLDNNNYAVIFKNKAADFGSMCPPRCKAYWRPFDI